MLGAEEDGLGQVVGAFAQHDGVGDGRGGAVARELDRLQRRDDRALGAVVAETCDAWLRDPGSRRDVEAYWATLRDASAHGHAAGNAAARDVHGKAGFVLALCDAFRRVDESRE